MRMQKNLELELDRNRLDRLIRMSPAELRNECSVEELNAFYIAAIKERVRGRFMDRQAHQIMCCAADDMGDIQHMMDIMDRK